MLMALDGLGINTPVKRMSMCDKPAGIKHMRMQVNSPVKYLVCKYYQQQDDCCPYDILYMTRSFMHMEIIPGGKYNKNAVRL